MSKRHNKPDKDGLPDWADDVTPADEVMQKFYAPTGIFKRGPIAVPAAPESAAPPASNIATEPQPSRPEEVRPSEESVADPRPEESPALGDNLVNTAEVVADSAAQVPPGDESTPSSARGPAPRKSVRRAASKLVSISQPPSATFESFSRRWSRYLYPGQMSVMRVLFAKTVEVGSDECFTRYSELAQETKMTRRNCINVVNALVDHGFVERLEVVNEAKGKGIRLKVNTEPRG